MLRLLLACCAAAAALAQDDRDASRPSFIGSIIAPTVASRIDEFMAYPHEAISFSLPAVELGFLHLGPGSTGGIQDWLYGQ